MNDIHIRQLALKMSQHDIERLMVMFAINISISAQTECDDFQGVCLDTILTDVDEITTELCNSISPELVTDIYNSCLKRGWHDDEERKSC